MVDAMKYNDFLRVAYHMQQLYSTVQLFRKHGILPVIRRAYNQHIVLETLQNQHVVSKGLKKQGFASILVPTSWQSKITYAANLITKPMIFVVRAYRKERMIEYVGTTKAYCSSGYLRSACTKER